MVTDQGTKATFLFRSENTTVCLIFKDQTMIKMMMMVAVMVMLLRMMMMMSQTSIIMMIIQVMMPM